MEEWMDITSRKMTQAVQLGMRTAVVIETITDPLGIYRSEEEDHNFGEVFVKVFKGRIARYD